MRSPDGRDRPGPGRRYEKPFERDRKRDGERPTGGWKSSRGVPGISTKKSLDARESKIVPGSAPARRVEKGGEKKPWEFPQKGMKRKLERRRKIAAAKAKGKKR
jgi:hypothetical protein